MKKIVCLLGLFYFLSLSNLYALHIENSGFEYDFNGWRESKTYATDCTFTITSEAYEGIKSAKLSINNNGYCHISNSVSIMVEQSGKYILSLYAKVMGISVHHLTIAVWKATEANTFPATIVKSDNITEFGTGYMLHQLVFESASGDYLRLELGIENSSNTESGYILFDKIEITPYTYEVGDMNGDGVLNIFDLQRLVNCVFGKGSCANGDLNSDGKYNIFDVQQLVNKIFKS